jgi:tetraacyldisaccharide 4'-kinase
VSRAIPVVSVGNLAMGGRGKTPVVAHIARLCLLDDERPAILTRGYGRRVVEDGVVVVSDGINIRADIDRAGDEPMMLAESLAGVRVLVSESRAVSAALAEHALGATVHILDDGFQHRAMARDIDIVIIAPGDLEDRRLPFGRLRESPRALARAHAVIVDGDAIADVRRKYAGCIFRLTRQTGDPIDAATGALVDRRAPIVAVAGIAAPQRFRAALEAAGWRVAQFLAFRDHHVFTPRDVAAIGDAVRTAGAAAVVTTAKDAVRLRSVGPLAAPLAVAPLEVRVDTADGGADFHSWLRDRLAAARAGRNAERAC